VKSGVAASLHLAIDLAFGIGGEHAFYQRIVLATVIRNQQQVDASVYRGALEGSLA